MAFNPQSILDSTKKSLGIDSEYDIYDSVIIDYINSVFSTLQQLGIGPVEGYQIEDASNVWSEFFTNPALNAVKSYMSQKVRLMFDPPSTAHAEAAMLKLAQETEWRLIVHAESPTESVSQNGS